MIQTLPSLTTFLDETGCDGLFISSYESVLYLTQFQGFNNGERDAFVFITKNNRYLFTNALYFTEVEEKISGFVIKRLQGLTKLSADIHEIIRSETLKKIAYESDDLTVSEWRTLIDGKFPAVGISLQHIRVRKKRNEIGDIRKACSISDDALRNVLPLIRIGMTEKELKFLLDQEIRRMGFEVAFPTIIAFGRNSAVPHHHTDTTKLNKNDTILIDFGSRNNGYCSDMTRTFFIGSPEPEMKKAYLAVLSAQKEAIHYIRSLLKKDETVYASDVDSVARDFLLSKGYPSFPHSLGHGIGLAVHEAPTISPSAESTLQDGMVFSVEPGIYFPDSYGIRIEDLYVIRENNLIRLTKFPSRLTVL